MARLSSLRVVSFERPKLTLLVLFLLTIVLGSGSPRLEVRNSFAGELPADDPINQDIEQVKAFFGERSVVLTGLEADNVYNPGTARRIKTPHPIIICARAWS
jgi:predicted RND superfamily exporter protein